MHQVPSNSITPSAASTATATAPPPLFDFDALSSFLIPRQELCDRLVSVAAGGARVLGFPVRIQGRRYARNEFIFNFAIVLPAGAGAAYASSYLSVVRKLAMLFRSLEEQGGFLSREDGGGGGAEAGEADATAGQPSSVDKGKVYALCEIVLEDLNNYCECMIPIGWCCLVHLYSEISASRYPVLLRRRSLADDTPFQMNRTPSTSSSFPSTRPRLPSRLGMCRCLP